eukprot:scaffold177_cov167-Alexandrium_tamarense.AAC.4
MEIVCPTNKYESFVYFWHTVDCPSVTSGGVHGSGKASWKEGEYRREAVISFEIEAKNTFSNQTGNRQAQIALSTNQQNTITRKIGDDAHDLVLGGGATPFADNTNTPVDASNVTSTADDASGDVSPWTEGASAVKNEDVQSMSPTRTLTTDASTQSQPDVQKPLDASKEESSNPTDDATDNIIEETKGNGKDSVIAGDTPPTVKAGESHPADEDENDVSKVVVTKDKEGDSQESGSNDAEPMNKVNVGVGMEDDADEAQTTTTAEGSLEFNPATIPSQDVTKGREDVKDTYMDVDAMENAGKTLKGAVVGGATAASAAAGEKLEERVKMNSENTGHLTNTEDKAAATAVKVNIPVQGEGGSIAVVPTGEAKGGVKTETGLSKVEEKE